MAHEQQSPAPAAAPELTELHETASRIRVLTGRLARRLRAAGDRTDLTLSQSAVLSRLDRHGPATTVELARAEHVRPQSMGTTLAGLEEAGLIERSPHPSDRRQVLISLAPEGLRRLREARGVREGWIAQALAERFDERERAVVTEAIGLLERLTEGE
ncbi:MarR family winged helix-turn-helix transcriptional regulator [Streptomyces huiliensis]|uniref:MarR family winged helix-turn-helix transcriptional regulator n=1 Tax=Streptomyces huiliensis TaxID=2876027 RepID=UPI001CC102C8|nr:MarR family transcriptional regulator [Streptomyces huiliensis]MBZ4319570.1 MarR family transcriptional regulator [Streptomyces huiliensis]